jgi:hypothetical protein
MSKYTPQRPVSEYLLMHFGPSFTTMKNNRQNHVWLIFYLYGFREQQENTKFLNSSVGSISEFNLLFVSSEIYF